MVGISFYLVNLEILNFIEWRRACALQKVMD